MDVKPSPCTAVLHSISTAYRSDCVLTELFICYILKQWQFLEKAAGPFRSVAKGHGETGILLVCEQTDWVRFGRETGRWITCGRCKSEAAWQVSHWEESRRCGRLWEEKVAGFPKDIALPCIVIAVRNSLHVHVFPATLPVGCLEVSLL